jgi:hypothetical protein
VSSYGVPLKEIDGSSCCVSNNFGPKFNNEKETHAQNQLCKIKWNVLPHFFFFKSHNFLDNFTSFGFLFGTSVH